MSYHHKAEAKRNSMSEYEDGEDELYGRVNSDTGSSSSSNNNSNNTGSGRHTSPKGHVEQEKRLRREIANSNERRRMQSINSGFESLKTLIPHTDGEKLSKASILQQTCDYITSLESEKTRLLSQNAKLKRELTDLGCTTESDVSSQGSPPPKRKKRDTESSDEGIGMSSGDLDEPTVDELKREMIYLRCQLDRERRLRMMLEEQTRNLESQLYPERLRQIASQVQAQMRYQEEKQKYLDEQRRIQEEQEEALASRQVAAPKRPHTTIPLYNTTASSMSRRNLETIVEAIRHLEGDNLLFDSVKKASTLDRGPSRSQDPDTESDDGGDRDCMFMSSSSVLSGSEHDDCKSESSMSGRDSPLSKCSDVEASYAVTATTVRVPSPHHHHQQQQHHHSQHRKLTTTSTTTPSSGLSSDKYPVSSQLLQNGPVLAGQFVPQRPAVIVQNLS